MAETVIEVRHVRLGGNGKRRYSTVQHRDDECVEVLRVDEANAEVVVAIINTRQSEASIMLAAAREAEE